MPSEPKTRWGAGWTQTGRWRWRPLLFGRMALEVEMERNVWAPRFLGHTPQNWRRETAWWKGEQGFDYPEDGRVDP